MREGIWIICTQCETDVFCQYFDELISLGIYIIHSLVWGRSSPDTVWISQSKYLAPEKSPLLVWELTLGLWCSEENYRGLFLGKKISISSPTQLLCICCDSFILLLCTASAAFISGSSVGLWADWRTTAPNISKHTGMTAWNQMCCSGLFRWQERSPAPPMSVGHAQISHERSVRGQEATQASLQWHRRWGLHKATIFHLQNVVFISFQQKLRNCQFQPGKEKGSDLVLHPAAHLRTTMKLSY